MVSKGTSTRCPEAWKLILRELFSKGGGSSDLKLLLSADEENCWCERRYCVVEE